MNPPECAADSGETDPIEAVHIQLRDAGVLARRSRHILALLVEGRQPLEDLVRRTAVPRRTVEELLTAAGTDVTSDRAGYRLTEDARQRYRERFALDELVGSAEPYDTPAELALLDRMRRFIDTAPSPLPELDHVAATPGTVSRRAEWMRDTYDLSGARVLLLGDHDLTSVALTLLVPSVSATVVDVDDRTLAHIDDIATEHELAIGTLHADLRFGIPPALKHAVDLVFTDPPYTPEGVRLFAARAAETLADANGRVLIAYGHSDRAPALGHKVQQELSRMGMVFEAILPGFHRYRGAQAIGSASDLYVCLPTSRTRKLALRQGIYTHGPRSVESGEREVTAEFLNTIGEHAGAPVTALRAPGWSQPIQDGAHPAAFDLRADPGPWLPRMLLACNAGRAVFVVGNQHPDITSATAQRELSELVAAKYTVRFHRSTPDSAHALVVASGHDEAPMRGVLRRAHGKIGNTWPEALIAESDGTLSQRAAGEHVRQLVPNPADLDRRLIDLPRHRIAALLRTTTPS